MSVGRKVDEVLRVLAALQTGGLCGEGWTPESGQIIDPTQILGPGRVIAHYRIEAVIGTGTFATVYRARDLTLDRDVALKLFKGTDAAARQGGPGRGPRRGLAEPPERLHDLRRRRRRGGVDDRDGIPARAGPSPT